MPMAVRYTTINGQIVCENRGGVKTLFMPDTLGNVIETRNMDTGAQTSSTTYWPYGEVRTQTGTNPSPFGFCGVWGYYTQAGQPTYVRARYYRPNLGRWQTVDPLWPWEDAYDYCRVSPTAQSDPSGLQVSLCKGRIIGGINHWFLLIDGDFCQSRIDYSYDGILINGRRWTPGGWKPVMPGAGPVPGPGDRCLPLAVSPETEKCLCGLVEEFRTSPNDDVLGGRHWRPDSSGELAIQKLGIGNDSYNFVTHNCQDFVIVALNGCGGPFFISERFTTPGLIPAVPLPAIPLPRPPWIK